MKYHSSYSLKLGKQTKTYYELLSQEDYEFKTKNIKIIVEKTSQDSLLIEVKANSLIDLKIANSAVIKSLEIIEKTLEI